MKVQQVIERIFWGGVTAGLAVLVGSALLPFDASAWEAAASAAIGGVLNGVLQFGRYRLSILPDPGDGLPGFEVSPKVSP